MVATNSGWWRSILPAVVSAACVVGCNNEGTLSPPPIDASGSNISHDFNLASSMPTHLSMMLSMSWFGIPASDPQPGPDPDYGNYQWGAGKPDGGCYIAENHPNTCSKVVTPSEDTRDTASRRRMLAGMYSVSGRDQESKNRTDLMLSTLHRSCDDGAGLDTWAVQMGGLQNSSLHPSKSQSKNADLPYRALTTFLSEADKNDMSKVIIAANDTTWYFHFGSGVGLGTCDDTKNNPKQNCIDALTDDFTDLVALMSPHKSAYTIDGKLVFYVYVDNQYLSVAEWSTLLQNARNASGQDFYVVASGENSSYFEVFDAIAPWVSPTAWKTTSGDTLYQNATNYVAGQHGSLISDVGSYSGRVVFAGASPGFDDYTEDWGKCEQRELPGSPYTARDPTLLDAEFDYFTSKNLKGAVFMTWDDFTEGSNIEPDVVGGTAVLTHVRDGLRQMQGLGADPAGDTALNDTWVDYGQPINCCFAGDTCPKAGVTPTLTCAGTSTTTSGSSSGTTSGSSSGGTTSGSSGTTSGSCTITLHQVSNDSIGAWSTSNILLPMDVNGDKKTDLVTIWDNGGNADALVSNSNGTDFVQASDGLVGGWNTENVYLAMDVNGDGKSDLVNVWNNAGTQTAQVLTSNGTAFTQVSNDALGGYGAGLIDLAMDVNGDGKSDLVVLWNNGGTASAEVNQSNGTSFKQVSNAAVGAWNTTATNLVADVDGDGQTDLVRILPSGTNAIAEVWLANGTGFSESSANVVGGWNTGDTYQLADVNGDGKADLIVLWPDGANTSAQVSISNGASFAQVSNDSLGPTVTPTHTLFQDVNGDGKVDLVQIYPNGSTTEAQVWVSNGTSFTSDSVSAQGGDGPGLIDLGMNVTGSGEGALVVLWQDTSQPADEQTRAQISVPECE